MLEKKEINILVHPFHLFQEFINSCFVDKFVNNS